MRNLKKILALVLALVMSLSLMATAGAADAAATSSETVTPAYETALQVLGKDGLKVFGGYTDGTIRPQNNITRAEVAAILYRIVTGDVTDAQAGIYTDMANVNFNDLTGANWAKGYINYCANAQLIVGVGGNQFKPLANITGYATLAMILRALGYDKNGEFKGSGWEIRTASKARELGILKNVSENQLGSSATRELVAELLFRAMLCSKVTYNALTQDYDETGVTLGYDVFKLEEVEGVVVANEYADVRRDADGRGYDSVLAADTTVLRDGDGKDRIIRIGSELDDLGMTRRAYTVEDKTVRNTYDLQVLALEDIDKDTVVYDDGEKLTSLSFSGARTDKDTQYFINYGEEAEDLKTTIKVTYQAKVIADTISARTEALAITAFCTKYNLKESALSKYDATSNPNGQLKVEPTYVGSGNYRIIYEPKTLGEIAYASSDYVIDELYRVDKGHIYSIVEINGDYYYRVEIAPGNVLSSADKDMIKAIFNTANLNPEGTTVGLIVNGEVFRGTQSRYDYSDWQSYESFLADCLETVTEAKNTTLSGNSIGWRLRVIDNDKDGYIDWVFQTRYTVTTVNKVAEDGTITLDTDETVLEPWTDNDKVNSLASKTAAMPGETVAAGDVVLYATIDGVNRVWKAEEVANVRVESINRTAATITTADNTTYNESTVHEHTSKKELIDSYVGNMAGKTAYTLYLDKYGNLAAFSQNLTGKLTLLTDGWSNVQKNGIEYAVKAWDTETQKFVQYDVTSGGNLFVATDNTNNNWNRIANFSPLNCYWNATTGSYEDNDVRTIMAYVETDGETATLTPVDMIYDTQRLNAQRDVRMIDMGTKIPDSSVSNTGTIYNTTYVGQSNWNNGYQNDPNYRNGVYYLNGGDVEVRALSNTVYYYVYRTWYGSSYSMVVNQVTGYSAGANYLTAAQKQYVEDVYVVGTKATHVDATGDPGKVYYTADAVVVELNDDFYANFKNDHEEIFIYDFEEVINSVNLEKVKAINGKGEAVEFTIDLTRSDRIYTEGSGKGSEPAPGLFYVWRTNETGDIWAVSRMSHAQIRESGHYDVGTVGYSKFTGTYDYFNIYNWYCRNSGYHWDAGHGDHTNMVEATDAVLQKERVGTANSAYYTLGYSSNSYGYVSNLKKAENAEDVMTEHANDIANGATNEVLVRYDSSNKIVYAVSFNHVYNNGENYAQKVYRGVLLDQAPVKAATNVTWYGISDGGIQILDRTFSDENPADNAITASYQATLEWAEANNAKRVPAKTPLVVENAADYYVTDADGKTVKEIPIAPIGGQEYTVRVKTLDGDWVDYVVKAVAASTDTSLTYNGVKYENGAVITYNGAENTIAGVLDNYFDWDRDFATADVTSAADENGKPVNAFTQWGNGYTATVKVTAENGEATYTIKFVKGNTPDVPADLEAAREAAQAALDGFAALDEDVKTNADVVTTKTALEAAVKGTDVEAIKTATKAYNDAVKAAQDAKNPDNISVKVQAEYYVQGLKSNKLTWNEYKTYPGKKSDTTINVPVAEFEGTWGGTFRLTIDDVTVQKSDDGKNYIIPVPASLDDIVNVRVDISGGTFEPVTPAGRMSNGLTLAGETELKGFVATYYGTKPSTAEDADHLTPELAGFVIDWNSAKVSQVIADIVIWEVKATITADALEAIGGDYSKLYAIPDTVVDPNPPEGPGDEITDEDRTETQAKVDAYTPDRFNELDEAVVTDAKQTAADAITDATTAEELEAAYNAYVEAINNAIAELEPEVDPVPAAREAALETVKSYKVKELETIDADEATIGDSEETLTNFRNRINALIKAATTVERIELLVKQYTDAVDALVPATDDTVKAEGFVPIEGTLKTENGVTTEDLVDGNGITITKKTEEENGYTTVTLTTSVPNTVIPETPAEENIVTDEKVVEALVEKGFLDAGDETKQALEVASFKVSGPEGVKPDIALAEGESATNVHIYAVNDVTGEVQTLAETASATWTIYVVVKVTVAAGNVSTEATEIPDFTVSFKNLAAEVAAAKAAVEALFDDVDDSIKSDAAVVAAKTALLDAIAGAETAEDIAKIYDENLVDENALVKALKDAITNAEGLKTARTNAMTTVDGLFTDKDAVTKTDEDIAPLYKAVTDALDAAKSAAEITAITTESGVAPYNAFTTLKRAIDLKQAKADATEAANDLVENAHLRDPEVVADELQALLDAIDAATNETISSIYEGGNFKAGCTPYAKLMYAISDNQKGYIAAIFAAPLHDTKVNDADFDKTLVGSYNVDWTTGAAGENDTVTITADNIKLHWNGAPTANLGYWVGFFVQAPETVNGTAVAQVKAAFGEDISSAEAKDIEPAEGAKGIGFYIDASKSDDSTYVSTHSTATFQWCDESGNALGDAVTLNVDWIDGTAKGWASPVFPEVTKANLYDNRLDSAEEDVKNQGIASNALATGYGVSAVQKDWDTVEVTVKADTLQQHLNNADPQALGYWLGLGAVAPKGCTGYGYAIKNANSGTSELDPLNAGDDNYDETGDKMGFSFYYNLTNGSATEITITWKVDSAEAYSITYRVFFEVGKLIEAAPAGGNNAGAGDVTE